MVGMGVPGPRRHAPAWTRDCGIGPQLALRSRAEIPMAARCESRRVRGKCACEWEPGVGTCEWEGAPWPRWADCIPARLGPLALGHGLPVVSELFEGTRPGHPPHTHTHTCANTLAIGYNSFFYILDGASEPAWQARSLR